MKLYCSLNNEKEQNGPINHRSWWIVFTFCWVQWENFIAIVMQSKWDWELANKLTHVQITSIREWGKKRNSSWTEKKNVMTVAIKKKVSGCGFGDSSLIIYASFANSTALSKRRTCSVCVFMFGQCFTATVRQRWVCHVPVSDVWLDYDMRNAYTMPYTEGSSEKKTKHTQPK